MTKPKDETVVEGDGLRERLTEIGDQIAAQRTPEETAIAQALATRIQPTGLAAIMEQLTAVDEDAMVIWTTKGPKNSRVESVSEVLAELRGDKRSLIVKVYASGKAKVFIDENLDAMLADDGDDLPI